MTWHAWPWIDLTVAVPLVGAVVMARIRNPLVAARWCLGITIGTLACAVMAWAAFATGAVQNGWLIAPSGRSLLELDELSAPLVVLMALLHVLTVLATARVKMNRLSLTGHLAGEAIRLATFACMDPWPLVVLLVLGTVPPYVELLRRGKPTRVYVLHMTLFIGLLIAGWAGTEADAVWAPLVLMAAVLVRSGTIPVHLWIRDLYEHCSFGTALLFVTPVVGVYASLRLVMPIAPDWVLTSIGTLSLLTAVYSSGLALVQREARHFFAYLFLSHASMVLVGLELHTPLSLAGALSLWFSVALSLGGLGLTLRAIEARIGRVPLVNYRGLYEHSPGLAVGFLLSGLASVGFPGTLGFVATELLVDGVVSANPLAGIGVVAATALNGIAVVRVYFLIFTGTQHRSAIPLGITLKERYAVLILWVLILGGGLVPQTLIASRYRVAESLLQTRTHRGANIGGLDTQPPTD